MRRDDLAASDSCLDTDVVIRKLDVEQHAGRRHEIVVGILCAKPGLDGMTSATKLALGEGQAFAGGKSWHEFDDIDAGHHLSDGMLDRRRGLTPRK